jgi:hypothetical protein
MEEVEVEGVGETIWGLGKSKTVCKCGDVVGILIGGIGIGGGV